MTKHYGAGPGAGIAQAVPVPDLAERAAGAQAVQVRRRTSETAAALPADPFARRPRLRGRGSHRLSGRPAVFVLASLIVALLASSAAPTPLYAIYQAQWHFTPITTTVVFGVYAMAALAALLTLGELSNRVGRRPVLLTAIAVHAGSLVIFATATGVPALLSARVVQGLSTGAALGAIGAAMLDMDRELGTFANAVAPGMGSASGAILSALAVRFLPDPTHLIYLALIGVLALQATAIAAMRETVSRAPGALASLRPEITLPRALRAPVLTAVPAGFGSGFQGGIRMVVPLAAAPERAGLVSLLYVVSYLGLGVPAVLAGFGVVHGGGLIDTTRYYGAAVIALAALALFGLAKNRPGRAAEPAACPAQGIR